MEFPVPAKKFPVPRKKIPCSAHLRELACNALKLRTDSRFSRMLRELWCKPLIYLIDWTQKTPERAESGKIPC